MIGSTRLRRRLPLAGTLFALLGITLAPAAMAQEEPQTGGTLVVAADGQPAHLNPALTASNGQFFIASKIVEPLAEMGPDGLRPLLAESWEGSSDGSTFTVHLRPGVTFSDGVPLTSADVAYSAMNVWKPAQNLGRVVFANLESVETPDELTAIFHFSKPTPSSLIEASLPALTGVLPKHVYEVVDFTLPPGEDPNWNLNLEPIGTGPFVFVEHLPDELYRLARNESYWGEGQPYVDEIVYQLYPDAASKASALETGDIDLTAFSAVPLADLARLDALNDVSVHTEGYEGIPYQLTLAMNHRNPILADADVRKALRMAIDPSFIVDTIFLGYGATESTGPIPQSATDYYTDDKTLYDFDPDAAETLLDEAGYERGDDGTRFALRLRPAPFFNETKAAGDYVKQALEEIGIAVEIIAADTPTHLAAVYTDHDFDLAVESPVYRGDPAISTTILFQGGLPDGIPFSNQWGYDDEAMNTVIADAAAATDPEERAELYKELQRLAADQLPLINLVEFTFTTVANDRVQNVANNPRWAVSNWADVWLASE